MSVIVVSVGPDVCSVWIEVVVLDVFHPALLGPGRVVRVVVMLAAEAACVRVYVTK